MTTNIRRIDSLPRAVYTGTDEPIKIKDPIYPRTNEIRRGSRLKFYGHSVENPQLWTVEDIISISKDERGEWLKHSVTPARTLRDIVVLRCDKPWKRTSLTLKWIVTSAAWRLDVKS
jgi:hypothetical protein